MNGSGSPRDRKHATEMSVQPECWAGPSGIADCKHSATSVCGERVTPQNIFFMVHQENKSVSSSGDNGSLKWQGKEHDLVKVLETESRSPGSGSSSSSLRRLRDPICFLLFDVAGSSKFSRGAVPHPSGNSVLEHWLHRMQQAHRQTKELLWTHL